LFPLVIVCGFILCINFLLDNIKFRQLFIKYHSKRNINDRILSNEEIGTASELWIDYEIKSQNKIIRLFILIIPLIIFFISINLLFIYWKIILLKISKSNL
jgi:hypothetical protein